MNLSLHPLCTLFPRMSGYEFDCLKLDIKANGQREPIITHDGMILDGGNRFRACFDLGIEPHYLKFGGDDLSAYVLSANLHRRHLTETQQAAIVSCVQDWAKSAKVGKPKDITPIGVISNQAVDNKEKRATAKDRASISGASIRTQQKADMVAKADPESAKQVARGEISLNKAVKQLTGKLPKKAAPEPIDENHYDPAEDALADAQSTVVELAEENRLLRDTIAVGRLDVNDQESATEIIAELRAENKTLTATLSAMTVMRDSLMRENKSLNDQCKIQRKQIEKLNKK